MPSEQLQRAIDHKNRMAGLVLYVYDFHIDRPATARAVLQETPRVVAVPDWLTVGARIRRIDSTPYEVVDVDPRVCLLRSEGGEPWPTETEELVQYWEPVTPRE